MLCNTPDTVEKALNAVRNSDRVVLDVETSGLLRWSTHIVGWVLTVSPHPDDSFYIPVRHAGGGNFPGCTVPLASDGWDGSIHPVESELAKIFGDQRKLVQCHNIQFDLWHARRHGVQVAGRLNDTMLTMSLINEHLPSFSLDSCCNYMKVQAKKGNPLYEYLARQFGGESAQKQMANYWRTNAEDSIVHDYATGDGT